MNNNLREIFSIIYDDNVEKIYRFVFLKVSSREIAQDLTSEIFLKGWEAFQKANNPGPTAEIENPRAFLYQIARNLVIDHYRERDKTKIVSVESVSMIDPRPTFEEKILTGSDIATIITALKDVKPEYQEVVVWHYVDDLSIREIAKILDKSEGTVRVTLHRALKSLKGKIEEV